MELAVALQIIAALAPYLPQLGIDLANAVDKFNNGETVDSLLAELQAKKDDLPPLPFGEGK